MLTLLENLQKTIDETKQAPMLAKAQGLEKIVDQQMAILTALYGAIETLEVGVIAANVVEYLDQNFVLTSKKEGLSDGS